MTVFYRNTVKLPSLSRIEQIKFRDNNHHKVVIKPVREDQLRSIYSHYQITRFSVNEYIAPEDLDSNFKLIAVRGLTESNTYRGVISVSHIDNVVPLTDNGEKSYLVKDTKGRLFKFSAKNKFPIFTYKKKVCD